MQYHNEAVEYIICVALFDNIFNIYKWLLKFVSYDDHYKRCHPDLCTSVNVVITLDLAGIN